MRWLAAWLVVCACVASPTVVTQSAPPGAPEETDWVGIAASDVGIVMATRDATGNTDSSLRRFKAR